LDLLLDKGIRVIGGLDVHPFVRFELREIGAAIEIVANVLRRRGGRPNHQQCENETELPHRCLLFGGGPLPAKTCDPGIIRKRFLSIVPL
jgi:hypothetical protein